MKIFSLHERIINCPIEKAECLIDNFADVDSPLWPAKLWPRENFDRPLSIGTIGAHGGTKYRLEVYKPGREINFKFISPKGYKGSHCFKINPVDRNRIKLEHTVHLHLKGVDAIVWRLAIRWVHDALIEDAFDSAEKFLTQQIICRQKWLIRVYVLRHLLGGSRLLKSGFVKLFKFIGRGN